MGYGAVLRYNKAMYSAGKKVSTARSRRHRLRRWAAIALLCLLASNAFAGRARTGRITFLEIQRTTPELIRFLVDHGYDIDGVKDDRVCLYAADDELQELDSLGILYQILEDAPAPYPFDPAAKGLGVYHDHAALTTEVQAYAATYPAICRLHNIGDSYQGRALWALLITGNPDTEEDEPEFKYISTMHGNEVVGVEMCLYLIDHLLTQYGLTTPEGQRITNLVDSTAISIMPLMNPDGQALNRRTNAQGYDLNREFPSYLQDGADGTLFDGDPLDAGGRPTEVQHVMQWTANNSFVLSANFHGGEIVVNYPYDEADVPANTYAACPDDALFVNLSERYAFYNPSMWNSTDFYHGITNGSDWYTIYGGMQDWNYRYVSCNEVTIELSLVKWPDASTLPDFWNNNKESMLHYLEAVHIGIRGLVTDAQTGDPVFAKILVGGNTHPVYTDPDVGDYHRMLLPGTYSITVSAPAYLAQTVTGITVGTGPATRADVVLQPESAEGEGEGEGEPITHSADQNGDARISLYELLRVIQFFNAGGYHCGIATEDGYAPGAGATTSCLFHASDYNPQDWDINLSELLRLIQFFNFGAYHPCPGSEDGFCPGLG